MLDPGKQSGPLNADINVPIIVIHSNSWSRSHSVFYGRPHFTVVHDLVTRLTTHQTPAWFLTSLGTTHPSVTDAPLIEPALLSWTTGATIEVREGIREYVNVSTEFLRFLADGKRRGVLAEGVMSSEYDHSWKDRIEEHIRHVPESVSKYWQVHVAPET